MAKKLLIVDDEPINVLLLERTLEILEDHDVEFFSASDGESALALIREEIPDVVLLDVMMPGMNGFEVCRAVKADPALAGVHVAILTAKGQELDRTRGADAGADAFLTKPFDPDDVLSRTAHVLGIAL